MHHNISSDPSEDSRNQRESQLTHRLNYSSTIQVDVSIIVWRSRRSPCKFTPIELIVCQHMQAPSTNLQYNIVCLYLSCYLVNMMSRVHYRYALL